MNLYKNTVDITFAIKSPPPAKPDRTFRRRTAPVNDNARPASEQNRRTSNQGYETHTNTATVPQSPIITRKAPTSATLSTNQSSFRKPTVITTSLPIDTLQSPKSPADRPNTARSLPAYNTTAHRGARPSISSTRTRGTQIEEEIGNEWDRSTNCLNRDDLLNNMDNNISKFRKSSWGTIKHSPQLSLSGSHKAPSRKTLHSSHARSRPVTQTSGTVHPPPRYEQGSAPRWQVSTQYTNDDERARPDKGVDKSSETLYKLFYSSSSKPSIDHIHIDAPDRRTEGTWSYSENCRPSTRSI